jgi:hypothetical protein
VSVFAIGALLIFGAALELAGIALVGWDVWDSRRTLREMSDPRWLPQQPQESLSHSLFAVMAGVAAGKTWRRATGVGLFACGLIVQTVRTSPRSDCGEPFGQKLALLGSATPNASGSRNRDLATWGRWWGDDVVLDSPSRPLCLDARAPAAPGPIRSPWGAPLRFEEDDDA